MSQCTKCRELRQSKKLHSKCTCDHRGDNNAPLMQPLSASSSSKCAFSCYLGLLLLTRFIARRFIPIIPALPNGLKDVIAASQSSTSLPPYSRQRGIISHLPSLLKIPPKKKGFLVDSLLNPCNCKDVRKCKCKVSQSASSSVSSAQISIPFDGLARLAHAAAMECSSPDAHSVSFSSTIDSEIHHSRSATPPNTTFCKHQKQSTNVLARMPGPDLAPLRFSPLSSFPPSIPDFPSMPSMSEIVSLAGSGCTCGVRCACPGCVEHTDSGDDTSSKRCGEGCGACIDHSIEILDPSQAKDTSFLDRFFAQAAALPPPPAHRKMSSYHLDPMNTHTSPQSSGSRPFDVVNLPKLKCCGGQCTCSVGQCTCRDNCAGSCLDVSRDRNQAEGTRIDGHALDDAMPVPRKPQGKCCSGSVLNTSLN